MDIAVLGDGPDVDYSKIETSHTPNTAAYPAPKCLVCGGYEHLPQGECTPDGPEYWVNCPKCSPEEFGDE